MGNRHNVSFSKRADDLERERNKRVLKQIREENERTIKEQGLDRPVEYAEGARFFGEVFLPGDLIVTKKEPNRIWKVLKREDGGRLGVAYMVQSMDEALIWAADVARGTKGGHLLELPESEWNTPGKGVLPEKPKWADPEEQAARQRWDKLQPLVQKLVTRLKGVNTDEAQNEIANLEFFLEEGYKDTLSPEHLEAAIRQAYWALRGVPFSKGHKQYEKSQQQKENERRNKLELEGLTTSERAQEERNRQKWFRLQPLAQKLIARLEPLSKGQAWSEHPRRELDLLREQLDMGYRARLVHQFENAIKEAYWALKGIPAQEGWKRQEQKKRTPKD